MSNLLALPVDAHATFRTLARTAENEMAYSSLSGAEHMTDISAEAACVVPPGYRLIRVDPQDRTRDGDFEIALICDTLLSVVYYNKVMIADLRGRSTSRNLVWRSACTQHAAVIRDVAENVMFRYILDHHDVILADSEQAGEGKFFWQRQLSKAIAYGLHAYYFHEATEELHPISTQGALSLLVDRLWSVSEQEQHHFALISKAQLPVSARLAMHYGMPE